MNFKKINILNIFSKKGSRDKDQINPNATWKTFIIIFSFINIVGALGGLYLFLKVNEGDIFVPVFEPESQSQVINEETLRKILSVFEERESNLNKIFPGENDILIDP